MARHCPSGSRADSRMSTQPKQTRLKPHIDIPPRLYSGERDVPTLLPGKTPTNSVRTVVSSDALSVASMVGVGACTGKSYIPRRRPRSAHAQRPGTCQSAQSPVTVTTVPAPAAHSPLHRRISQRRCMSNRTHGGAAPHTATVHSTLRGPPLPSADFRGRRPIRSALGGLPAAAANQRLRRARCSRLL